MSTGEVAPVAVLVVTHDDAPDVPGCLAAIAALAPAPCELLVVDCASADDSVARARASWPRELAGEVRPLGENRGFAGGMNVAFAASSAPWVLTLNADARPAPDYLDRLLARATAAAAGRVGAVTGRLVRPPADGARRLDACGMYLTPAWRHHDRGSSQLDRGQLATPARVFGGTGAATLFARAAVLDVALEGEMFDPRFHSYREDAELAFRLAARRWQVLYEPRALCEHRRTNLPSRRRVMRPEVNFHSLKNRYLLRLYHQSASNFLWTLPFAGARDLMALAWVLLAERSSLAAYAWVWRHRGELLAHRRRLRARRTASWRERERWFLRRSVPL